MEKNKKGNLTIRPDFPFYIYYLLMSANNLS